MSHHDEDMIPSRLMDAASAGCEESQMLVNRRALLGMSAGLFSWACLPKSAAAAGVDQRRLLVVVLRGALDGIHVAYRQQEVNDVKRYRRNMFGGNDAYINQNYAVLTSDTNYGIRPVSGQSSSGTQFMLHNKLVNFRNMYRWGEAILVHAIAPPLQTRSHFDCQVNLESGQPGLRNINNEGWLSRFMQGIVSEQPLTRAFALNGVPLIIKGAAPVQSWSAAGMQNYGQAFLSKFVLDYQSKPVWQAKLNEGLALDAQVNQLALDQSGVTMPFAMAGMLMSKDTGPRIAVLNVDGLDTHSNQIRVLDRKLEEIDAGLGAFRTAMRQTEEGKNAWNETVVVCVTEFGRTLQDNASGTDHGVGTVAFLVGGNVKGRRILTDWPSIDSSKLVNQSLAPTYDTRHLFRGLLRDHLGCDNDEFLSTTVFPGTKKQHAMGGLVKVEAEGLSIKPSSAWARA